MAKKDKRIDAYISAAAPFAKPILKHLRKLVHEACPEVEETIKWGMPSFDYKGPFFSFASFNEHCALGFWKAGLIEDKYGYLQPIANQGGEAMGNFGRVRSLRDLPSDRIILDYIKQAKRLNDEGIKKPARKTAKRKPLEAPDYMLTAIQKNKRAWATFENFSPSNKRDYIEWITEAKTEATRDKRLTQAIAWIAEGKPRNWKYMQQHR
jgi:uncharacterized protein YdeI (YjbR/CyaY-like superfamily)